MIVDAPSASRRFLIVAPPMTPNGDLHLGHISGPYLGADIFKRHLAQEGIGAHYVLSSDDNQSYVDTTARRLETAPDTLIAESRRRIVRTLADYDIDVDLFGEQGRDYEPFVIRFFETLQRAGLIETRDTDVLFDRRAGAYAVEAFVSGYCPRCLDGSAGGICESCGHPNRCTDLLGLEPDRFEVRREKRLVFDLEALRPELDEYLFSRPTHRPALARLISTLLAERLAPFVLSYKAPRGIGCAWAGLPDQQLNVWGEMFPAHFYFLEQAAGRLDPADVYVQFLGFDNSYFYIIVHAALALAARKCDVPWPQPSAFITNQFYNLEAYKFSTSKGHLIWAHDFAARFNVDVIRLFLALHGPEYQEASFTETSFIAAAGAIVSCIDGLVDAFNTHRRDRRPAGRVPAALTRVMSAPVDLRHYSAAHLARRALNGIQFVRQAIAAGDVGLVAYAPGVLAQCLETLCPAYVRTVRERFPETGRSWETLAPAGLDVDLPLLRVAR